MPEISIIVPVYKVEKYLRRCINSILKQTFSDFELILVDDGSLDNSGNICDEYAECDKRIQVIHKNNGGVSSARNIGIQIASGNFLAFVDSDDFIEADMYEKLHDISREYDADIVMCGINSCRTSGEIVMKILQRDAVYHNEGLILTLFDTPNPVGGGACNKLFRRTEINLLFPENIAIGEDVIYLYNRFTVCNKAVKISDSLYNAVERDDSATRENMASTLYQYLESYKILLEKTVTEEISVQSKAVNKVLDISLLNIKLIKRDPKISKAIKNKYIIKTIKIMIMILFQARKKGIVSSRRVFSCLFEMVRRYFKKY